MVVGGHPVIWSQWQDAYQWDRQNPLQIHHHLTHEHLFLDSASKMRNRLAEDVLNTDMLQLFLERSESMGERGVSLRGCVDILKQTSRLIDILDDSRPINDPADERLEQLESVNRWFKRWEEEVMANTGLSTKEKRRRLLSAETREDLESSIIGFVTLVRNRYDFNIYMPNAICSRTTLYLYLLSKLDNYAISHIARHSAGY